MWEERRGNKSVSTAKKLKCAKVFFFPPFPEDIRETSWETISIPVKKAFYLISCFLPHQNHTHTHTHTQCRVYRCSYEKRHVLLHKQTSSLRNANTRIVSFKKQQSFISIFVLYPSEIHRFPAKLLISILSWEKLSRNKKEQSLLIKLSLWYKNRTNLTILKYSSSKCVSWMLSMTEQSPW